MVYYFHSVRLDQEKCKGCTNCIKGCPTEAIRVRNGKAHILEERCIDCGECIRVCPEHAKYAITDNFADINDYKYRIAIPAPSFFGQFSDKVSDIEVIATLKMLGFDDVIEVALGADYVSMAYRKYFQRDDILRPAISSACPAVVRLVQVRYPSLIPHIIPIESPMAVAGFIAKDTYSKKYNVDMDEIGVFFITPCPAKVTAVRQPVAGQANVDGVISISEMYGLVMRNISKLKHYPEFLKAAKTQASANGLRWARPGGESIGFAENISHVQVQGIPHIIKVLDQFEMGKLKGVDFLELQACPGGCLGGALTVEDPFVARVYINKLARKRLSEADISDEDYERMINEGLLFFDSEIEARQIMSLDEDVNIALSKLEKIERLANELPGLDCGACGSPTCRALAEDIVQGKAYRTDCPIELRNNVKDLAERMLELADHLPPTIEDTKNKE
jgi:iron only hydrogenase large subunit-like protein